MNVIEHKPDDNATKHAVYNMAVIYLNKIREAAGFNLIDNLPKGYKQDVCECPVARAMKPIWTKAGTSPSWNTREIDFSTILSLEHGAMYPPHVSQFMYWFDNGEYPGLEA